MENIIITLICVSLIMVGALNLTMSSFNSIDILSDSWKDSQSKIIDMSRTVIAALSTITGEDGDYVEINVRNDGNTILGDFDRWDVIVTYQQGDVQWLSYSTVAPGWYVEGIYYDGNPEIYGPNILDPGEDMKIILKLSPPVAGGTTNLATITTNNGITTQIMTRTCIVRTISR